MSSRRFRYFHLFWLPVSPLGSATSVTCRHCKLQLDTDELDSPAARRADQGCAELSRPRWHFIGTMLVVGLIAMNLYDEAILDAKAAEAAADPRVGDVWIVDVKDSWGDEDYTYRYSAGRISDVSEGAVELTMSEWSYLVSSGAREDALEALKEQQDDYFVHQVSLSVPQLVALQETDDFRLLR
ncbi:MAG: hypothetical protein AAGG11_01495 [Pseudomonadota bacterium]